MAAGFVMLYIGVKGNASAVVNAFRPSTAAQGAPATSTTPPPASSGTLGNPTGGLYPNGNTTLPGGSVSITGPGATGLVLQ
jgi:hypothetical protein